MSELLWGISRASGIVSLLLFTGTVVLGILTWRGGALPGLPKFAVSVVHRDVSLLATVFLIIHVVTLLGDPYAQVSVLDGLVPFFATANPFWRGLGTVAADLLVAIIVTSLARHRLPAAVFRVIHWAVYPLWVLAFAHGLGSGTDAASAWYLGISLAALGTVVMAVVFRIVASRRAPGAYLEQGR